MAAGWRLDKRTHWAGQSPTGESDCLCKSRRSANSYRTRGPGHRSALPAKRTSLFGTQVGWGAGKFPYHQRRPTRYCRRGQRNSCKRPGSPGVGRSVLRLPPARNYDCCSQLAQGHFVIQYVATRSTGTCAVNPRFDSFGCRCTAWKILTNQMGEYWLSGCQVAGRGLY